jgi:hypothetical protein
MKIWADFQEPIVKVKADDLTKLENEIKELKKKFK